MTVKGTSNRGSSKSSAAKSSVKATARPVSSEPKVVSTKSYDKAPVSGGGNRRTLGIVGCLLGLLVLCCVAGLAAAWFSGDSIVNEILNNIQIQ
jgi:hypothetical protein